ncbi:MAG: ABC transporter substrate-binding protein [Solirubrobacterales bacterium]
MRRRAAIVAVLALIGGASGCGGNGDGTHTGSGLLPAGGGGTLSYALPSLPATLDPLTARGRPALTVTRQVYEPLIERLQAPYAQGGPQAGLALAAQPSGDRTTWTVTLRQGVRFQDGTPFNAGSVLANSRRWQSSPVGRRLLPHLFAVDSPRPDVVRFLLDKPVPDLVARLSSSRLGIVSPLALQPQSGQGAGFRPEVAGSGTGAFQPSAAATGRIELSRFAGWWGSAAGLGPALDGVTFVPAPKQAQRLRLLQSGAVQVADPLGAAGLRAAEADPLLDTIGGPVSGIGTDGSVRGIDSARAIPVLSGVWLTRLTG